MMFNIPFERAINYLFCGVVDECRFDATNTAYYRVSNGNLQYVTPDRDFQRDEADIDVVKEVQDYGVTSLYTQWRGHEE